MGQRFGPYQLPLKGSVPDSIRLAVVASPPFGHHSQRLCFEHGRRSQERRRKKANRSRKGEDG